MGLYNVSYKFTYKVQSTMDQYNDQTIKKLYLRAQKTNDPDVKKHCKLVQGIPTQSMLSNCYTWDKTNDHIRHYIFLQHSQNC